MSSNTKAVSLAEQAVDWLRDRLAAGPVASHQVRAEAPFTRGTVERARYRLNVVVSTGSMPGRPFVTYWSLPDEPKEERVMIPSTKYSKDEILAYNQAWLDQQQGKAFYFTPPSGERQQVWLGRLPVTYANLEQVGLDAARLPGVELFADAEGGKR